jgi:hypothetical protein
MPPWILLELQINENENRKPEKQTCCLHKPKAVGWQCIDELGPTSSIYRIQASTLAGISLVICFSEYEWAWNGVHSAIVRINEELLERKQLRSRKLRLTTVGDPPR